MILKELISFLERQDPSRVLVHGFGAPHSDRGDYSNVAFDPAFNVSIGSMLTHAKSALGTAFTGWKGGDYMMYEDTPCFIGKYGECGEPVDIMIIRLLEDDLAIAKAQITLMESNSNTLYIRGIPFGTLLDEVRLERE